jgi:two-component system, OmpR family, response regulator
VPRSRFVFAVHLAPDERVIASAKNERVSSPRLKVLLVEDSTMLIERLSEALQQIPAVDLIGTATTEKAAIKFACREAVDVIILDLQLKEGTGFGVMRALAATELKPRILVLTNYNLPEYKNAALGLGATHFLDKARDCDRLPELLQAMCEHAK